MRHPSYVGWFYWSVGTQVNILSMFIDRLDNLDVNKNEVINGAGYLDINNVTREQANCTGMPSDQKSKQSCGTNLSFYKHLILYLVQPIGAHIRHQYRKRIIVLCCNRCLINSGVEKMNYI
jgi:hypothetical protein